MKYVPSQIITATLRIALLRPAAFWETEVVKEDVTAAKSGGTGHRIPWIPQAQQTGWAGAPTHSSCPHQSQWDISQPRAPEEVSYSYTGRWAPDLQRELTLATCCGYCYQHWETLPNWFHSLLPWISHYHKLSTNKNTFQFHFRMYVQSSDWTIVPPKTRLQKACNLLDLPSSLHTTITH